MSGTSGKLHLHELIEHTTNEWGVPYSFEDRPLWKDPLGFMDFVKTTGFTDIVIAGGDGTVNQITGCLRQLPVRFGIIPVGSGNGLANAAGIPSDPQSVLNLIHSANSQLVDAFTVNGKYACMLSGVGLDAQVAKDFAEQDSRGLLTYARESIVDFFKAKPYGFQLRACGTSFTTDAYFISIANSNQFGNNFKIAPSASLRDGLLDVVVIRKMKKYRLPFTILNHIQGRNSIAQFPDQGNKEPIVYFQASEVEINNFQMAPLHLDGDPEPTSSKISFKIIPACFRLIC